MSPGYPLVLSELTVVQVTGHWVVIIPNDKYPDSKRLPDGRFCTKSKFSSRYRAEQELERVNEWARLQGGRPVNPVVDPYLDVFEPPVPEPLPKEEWPLAISPAVADSKEDAVPVQAFKKVKIDGRRKKVK